jgi:hypothetical protein
VSNPRKVNVTELRQILRAYRSHVQEGGEIDATARAKVIAGLGLLSNRVG